MKKRYYLLFSLLIIFSVCITGCQKEEVSVSNDPVIETPEISQTEAPVTELPEETPDTDIPVETPADESDISYPYWWELHDYNLDQELLAEDGEIKNLSIQPGDQPDELYVTWFSRSDSRGKVKFHKDGLFNDITVKATTEPSVSVAGYYRNSALISGLDSNTVYTYYVKNGHSVSPTYTYETGDLFSTDFTFTIAGDPEIGLGDPEVLPGQRSIWRVMLNRMKSQIPESDFLLVMGDQIADPASETHYDYFLDNSVLYSTALVPVMGNHDVGSGFFGDHFSLPNRNTIGTSEGRDGDYWFTRGNVLFMVLNNPSPTHYTEHETFVELAVQQNPDAKWRVIVSHYSPASMVEKYQGAAESVKSSYAYMAKVYDIDLFLGGHDHIYTRSYLMDENFNPVSTKVESEFYNPENPIYVIFNGSTDALLRQPDNDYPWAAVCVQNNVPQLSRADVTENSFTITTYDADSWTVIDSFTIYKD